MLASGVELRWLRCPQICLKRQTHQKTFVLVKTSRNTDRDHKSTRKCPSCIIPEGCMLAPLPPVGVNVAFSTWCVRALTLYWTLYWTLLDFTFILVHISYMVALRSQATLLYICSDACCSLHSLIVHFEIWLWISSCMRLWKLSCRWFCI